MMGVKLTTGLVRQGAPVPPDERPVRLIGERAARAGSKRRELAAIRAKLKRFKKGGCGCGGTCGDC